MEVKQPGKRVEMLESTYREQSRVFLRQAIVELSRGDLRQASEKGWGASSQIVKAAADERGWPHRQHRTLERAVVSLIDETGDPTLGRLFNQASALHTNFYEGDWSVVMVRDALGQVSRFVTRVEALLASR